MGLNTFPITVYIMLSTALLFLHWVHHGSSSRQTSLTLSSLKSVHLFLFCVNFEISWTNLSCQCHGCFSALNFEIGNWNMPFIIINLSSKLESWRESNGRQESAVCVVGLGELLCLAGTVVYS